MTELSIIADSKPEGLTFKCEIKTNENTTEDEMVGINSLSDQVNQILKHAQRRSSLKSDWQK